MSATGLGARLAGRLARGRAAAASRMGAVNGGSDVTVRRQAGRTTGTDGVLEVPAWTVVHDTIPARVGGIATGAGSTHAETVGTTTMQTPGAVLHLAWDTTDLQSGDCVEVVAGELTGTVYRVVDGAVTKDQATARRLLVDAVPRPKEWS